MMKSISDKRFNIRSILYLILPLFFFSACVPQEKLIYLSGDLPKSQFELAPIKEYKIQPGDNLYIQVLGLDTQTADLFSIQPSGVYRQYQANDLSAYLSSYSVNPEGYIEFPIIGEILVKDWTIDEIKELVQKAIAEYMRDATVIVKLVNFRISVLGEVARPGQYPVYQTKIGIFEAIALAGDLTPWGDRKNVQLVRRSSGTSEIVHLDLSSRDILESEYFFLMPDDIIYVTPMKAKTFAFTTFPYSIVFSTITTTLLILNFFR